MDISNRTLAIILVITIIVSTVCTFVSLNRLDSLGVTGYVTSSNSTGTASVSVVSITSLKFDVNSINFGTGSINSTGGFTNCTMDINSSTTINQAGCTGFNTTNTAGPFILENAGTTYINITMNSTDNSSTFIGGGGAGFDNPLFQFEVSPNETNSCVSGLNYPNWTDTNIIKGPLLQICGNLSPVDTIDTLRIGVRVAIPLNSLTGARTATFTAQGTG